MRKGEKLCPMTKAHIPTENSKTQRDNTINATKNFDYTTIDDRTRTASWSSYNYPTGVVKPVCGRQTFHLLQKLRNQKDIHFKN